VHRLGVELALNDEVGLPEARLEVSTREHDMLSDVGRLVRPWSDAFGVLLFVQQRGAGPHRFDDVDHVRQD
jgi:hypothetical protein